MARFVPLAVEAVSYLLVAAAAFATDIRLGVAVLGLIGLRESHELLS
jgi:hypothetical protein